MKRLRQFFTIILLTGLLSCATTKSTSTVYSDNYDKTTDRTSVMILPYGEIKVPGKWTKIRESTVSGEYFFVGPDSAQIGIAMQPWNRYEFSYKNPEVTTDNFVRKFYEWDSNYLKAKTKGELRILTENKEKNYLVWNLANGQHVNEYFLFGLKGKVAYNLNVTADKWDEEKKVKFLEGLFNE